jgi:flagellin-like protein
MMMTKLRKNAKALSPIFAVLILIAIAVIAGIVVYMFTSGTIATMTGGGTTGQEKVAVQGVDVTLQQAYAQNTGGIATSITNYLIKDSGGNIVSQAALSPVVDLPINGTLTTVDISVGLDALGGATGTYTVTLVSSKGGSFVSAAFQVPSAP